MNIPKEFMEMVDADILRIENSKSLEVGERLSLHRELDGRYQACIVNWYHGFWGTNKEQTGIFYSYIDDDDDQIVDNLKMMKAKLEAYKFQVNAVQVVEGPATQVNVTTNVNVSVTFDETRQKIEDMTALSRGETDEILKRIDELEAISKEKSSRKTKWEKVKPIIAFVMDKGADVAVAVLTLIIQMKLGAS